jgi:catechol 2,3-dioxygenase-like lactoylglutathione lyase family enzyme
MPLLVTLAAAPPLDGVVLDHVAVAVDDPAAARAWWRDRGATPITGFVGEVFGTEQLRMSNGGKVELLSRGTGDGFVDPFLRRFGSGRIHHVTLKVPGPLTDAVAHLRSAGLDVVDVSTDRAHWHEAFLRPSQVGGLIVQIAWTSGDDTDFAVRQGHGVPPPPDPAAPPLRRVVLGHPDPGRAAALWAVLGAEVVRGPGRLRASWPGSPIELEIRHAATPGPIGLVLDGSTDPGGASSPPWLADPPDRAADAAAGARGGRTWS